MSDHYTDERRGIHKRLEDGWVMAGTPIQPLTPIKYWGSNRPLQGNPAEFIAIQITSGGGEQESLGDPPQWIQYTGVVTVQIFVKEDGGPADHYAAKLDDIFKRAEFAFGTSGTMRFRIPDRRYIGVRNGRFQVNWVCEFVRWKLH